MKKLIITRILAFFTYILALISAAIMLYVCGIDTNVKMTENWAMEVCYSLGIIAMFLLYFFAGKKFYEISIKKMILVFFIWTVLIFAATAFINKNMFYLNGGYSWLSVYIDILGFTKSPYLSGIIGFLVEIIVIIMGIYMGRIKAGKTEGKYVIFLSKFYGIIIAYVISCLMSAIYVLASPKAPLEYLEKKGMGFSWIIAMLVVALWYIYAGFKSFRLNLKITLTSFLLWDALGIFLWVVFEKMILLSLSGGYMAFSMVLIDIANGKHKWLTYIGAYLLETLFITAGVLLGRHFNKKKVLPEKIAE